MEKFNFNPAQGFLDSNVFHDPNNETETREQLQKLHDQTKDFINLMQTMYGDEAIILRLNAAKSLEYSLDGVNWNEVIGRGERGPAGPGVVPGGTTGQILTKKSGTDYDTEWVDLPEATDTIVGGVKVKNGTDSSIIIVDKTIKINQLVINNLNIQNAPVQTLTEPMWFDDNEDYMKYIDVAVDGVVESAKPDHWILQTSFQEKCGYIQCLDGVLRFILLSSIEDTTITTTVKEVIIQYLERGE